MSRTLAYLSRALALACLAFPAALHAEEVISRYQSDIVVEQDGTLDVTEIISVMAEGERIRHGIFRDFPLDTVDSSGHHGKVGFTLVGVERDGQDEPSHTETIDNGIRIYAGSADSTVSRGPHVYTFHYRTDRQIRFFDDHDELYWNVTGNGWQFPILAAVAHVTLPGAIPADGVTYYTGAIGSTLQEASVTSLSGNEVTIAAQNRLEPGEGLTIAVKQPKGAIAAPSASETFWWSLKDNLGAIIGWGGFLGLFGFYYRRWDALGRDPAKGVMVPRWDPPGGLSPALVYYVDNKSIGNGFTALSASALSLAVKGLVTLEDLKGSITLRRTDKVPEKPLPEGEDVLMEEVSKKGFFVIDRGNGVAVQALGNRFNGAVTKGNSGKYYKWNGGTIALGVLASAAIAVAAFLFGNITDNTLGLSIALAVSAGVFGLVVMAFVRGAVRRGSILGRVFKALVLGVVGSVSMMVLLGVLAGTVADTASTGVSVVTAAGALVVLNVVFGFLMGAPTALGREMMDGIEGFRTYMTLAEADRMNMAGAPAMSPGHYEKLLPYAVALGVEKPWSAAFQTWLAAAVAAGTANAYHPYWYSGREFEPDRFSSFTSTMASTIASTIPEPKSSSDSSGFSGGSSGGGGGGGGGGGW